MHIKYGISWLWCCSDFITALDGALELFNLKTNSLCTIFFTRTLVCFFKGKIWVHAVHRNIDSVIYLIKSRSLVKMWRLESQTLISWLCAPVSAVIPCLHPACALFWRTYHNITTFSIYLEALIGSSRFILSWWKENKSKTSDKYQNVLVLSKWNVSVLQKEG